MRLNCGWLQFIFLSSGIYLIIDILRVYVGVLVLSLMIVIKLLVCIRQFVLCGFCYSDDIWFSFGVYEFV